MAMRKEMSLDRIFSMKKQLGMGAIPQYSCQAMIDRSRPGGPLFSFT